MASFMVRAGRFAGAAGGLAVAAALALASSSGAIAQEKKKAAPAAAAPAAAQAEPVMWVKLCEKAPVLTKDKDGKDVRAEKGICLTHHERLDGNTGMVLVSAAIRQVEDQEKQHLMVMVPLGMALQPGLRATVYSKELWDKAQKNEKVDDAKLTPIKLNFSLCHPAGCTAEIDLTKEIVDQLRGNAGVMIFAINANGQVIAFPVPLSGFSKALDGPAADNAEYTKQRRVLMEQIAANQKAAYEAWQKQQQEKGGAPAAAPAEKKK
jgi:invasion protein IalB